jgi:hypothetical protein
LTRGWIDGADGSSGCGGGFGFGAEFGVDGEFGDDGGAAALGKSGNGATLPAGGFDGAAASEFSLNPVDRSTSRV